MGYTHYFTFKVPKGIKAAKLEADYQAAILECAKVAKAFNQECSDKGLTDARLAGYTAHTKIGQYGGIELNGKGELAHESFTLREHFKQNLDGFGNGFAFCKTARKPYDTVVVACLSILKYRLGDAIEVSSDGEAGDWVNGVLLARRTLKRKVPNPIGKASSKSKPKENKSNQTEVQVIIFKTRRAR